MTFWTVKPISFLNLMQKFKQSCKNTCFFSIVIWRALLKLTGWLAPVSCFTIYNSDISVWYISQIKFSCSSFRLWFVFFWFDLWVLLLLFSIECNCFYSQAFHFSATLIVLNIPVPDWVNLFLIAVITGVHSLPHKVMLIITEWYSNIMSCGGSDPQES